MDLKDKFPDVVEAMKKLLEEAREDMGDDQRGIKGKNTRPVGKVDDPKPLTQYNPDHPYIVAEYDVTCLLPTLKEHTGD